MGFFSFLFSPYVYTDPQNIAAFNTANSTRLEPAWWLNYIIIITIWRRNLFIMVYSFPFTSSIFTFPKVYLLFLPPKSLTIYLSISILIIISNTISVENSLIFAILTSYFTYQLASSEPTVLLISSHCTWLCKTLCREISKIEMVKKCVLLSENTCTSCLYLSLSKMCWSHQIHLLEQQ